jgi:hypothetical protein
MSEVQQCIRPDCQHPWWMACLCGPMCPGHALDHMDEETPCQPSLVRAFAVIFRTMIMPVRGLDAEIAPARSYFVETNRDLFNVYYPMLRASYEDAGAPLGDDEMAPLHWLEAQFDDGAIN